MPRAAMNEMTTLRWTFDEDVFQYVAAGYDAIGVWRPKLSDFGEEKGLELLEESGLAVSSLHWIGGFTGTEGNSYAESIEDAKTAIQLAASMKADCVVAHTGPRGGHTHKHLRRLVVGAFRELCPLAAELNVLLAIEPMHPAFAKNWTFATSMEEAISLLDEVDHPSLQLDFDTYHLCQTKLSFEQIREIAPRVAIVQIGDSRENPGEEQSRCPLGEGNLPLAETFAALHSGGYQGYWEVELLGEELEAQDHQKTITQAREALLDLV